MLKSTKFVTVGANLTQLATTSDPPGVSDNRSRDDTWGQGSSEQVINAHSDIAYADR